MPELRASPQGVSLRVRVQPRAPREALAGVREGMLLVRLTAPPVEGKANEALVRFLSRLLEVPVSSVVVRQGRAGRDKVVEVRGAEAAGVEARLRAGLEGAHR